MRMVKALETSAAGSLGIEQEAKAFCIIQELSTLIVMSNSVVQDIEEWRVLCTGRHKGFS